MGSGQFLINYCLIPAWKFPEPLSARLCLPDQHLTAQTLHGEFSGLTRTCSKVFLFLFFFSPATDQTFLCHHLWPDEGKIPRKDFASCWIPAVPISLIKGHGSPGSGKPTFLRAKPCKNWVQILGVEGMGGS